MNDKTNDNYRQYLEKLFSKPVSERPVKSIVANPPYHGVPTQYITVGQTAIDMEPNAGPQRVLAIFESMSYLVVAPGRGDGQGMPFIFPRSTIVSIVYDD